MSLITATPLNSATAKKSISSTMSFTQHTLCLLFVTITVLSTVQGQLYNVTSVESLLSIDSTSTCAGTVTEKFIISFGNFSTDRFTRNLRFSNSYGSYYKLKNVQVTSPDVTLTFGTFTDSSSQNIYVYFNGTVANRIIQLSFQYQYNALVSKTVQEEAINLIEFGYGLSRRLQSVQFTIQLPEYSDLDSTQLNTVVPTGFSHPISNNVRLITISGRSEQTAEFSVRFPMKTRNCNPSGEESRQNMRLAVGLGLGLGLVAVLLAIWGMITLVIYLVWGHDERAKTVMTVMWSPCICICLIVMHAH